MSPVSPRDFAGIGSAHETAPIPPLTNAGVLSLRLPPYVRQRALRVLGAPAFPRLESLQATRGQAEIHRKAVLAQAEDPHPTQAQRNGARCRGAPQWSPSLTGCVRGSKRRWPEGHRAGGQTSQRPLSHEDTTSPSLGTAPLRTTYANVSLCAAAGARFRRPRRDRKDPATPPNAPVRRQRSL